MGRDARRYRRSASDRLENHPTDPAAAVLRAPYLWLDALVDLDISLLPEAIDPFLGRFLALSLLEFFLNPIPYFGQRYEARRLLVLAVEDIKRISDLNHLADFRRRKTKCNVCKLLVQGLAIDHSPIPPGLSSPIHRIGLRHRGKVCAFFNLSP